MDLSAHVSYTQTPMPSISGGGLTGTYEFFRIYFQWGSDDTKGSEHVINGKAWVKILIYAVLSFLVWNIFSAQY